MGPARNIHTALSPAFAIPCHKNPPPPPVASEGMEGTPEARRGRKPKPTALRRTEWLKTRANPLELEAAKARAEMAGLSMADYIRRQCCGAEPELIGRAASEVRTLRRAEEKAPGDFDALVARFAATMPRTNAEHLARREMARGR